MPHPERHQRSRTSSSNSNISDDNESSINEKSPEINISNGKDHITRKRSIKSRSASRKIAKNQSTIDTLAKLIAPKPEIKHENSHSLVKKDGDVEKKSRQVSTTKDTKKINHISISKNCAYYPEDTPWAEDDSLVDNQPEADEPIVANSPAVPMLVTFIFQFRGLVEGLPDLGPQDIEEGVQTEDKLSPDVELLMCRLITLLLNRKKPVEPGRYGRALEDVAHHAKIGGMGNLPESINIKAGPNSLSWQDRLEFLRLLLLWALGSSTLLRENLTASSGTEFGPAELGIDAEGNKYFIAQGDLTRFRIYRQTNPRLRNVSWQSVAGTTAEVDKLIKQLIDSTPGAAIIENDAELEKLQKDFVKENSNQIAKSWEPIDENKPLFVTQLVSRLSRELEILREKEAERIKEMHKERRRKELEDMASKARQGEGAYAGRTRGKKINYNVDDVYGDEMSDGEEYDNDTKDTDELERNGSRRSARIRGVKVTVEPDIDMIERQLYHRHSNGGHKTENIETENIEDDRSKMVVLKYSSPPRNSSPDVF